MIKVKLKPKGKWNQKSSTTGKTHNLSLPLRTHSNIRQLTNPRITHEHTEHSHPHTEHRHPHTKHRHPQYAATPKQITHVNPTVGQVTNILSLVISHTHPIPTPQKKCHPSAPPRQFCRRPILPIFARHATAI